MDRLADYVQWMEDFPIEATGLRDADALVLCALSYFDLSPLFKGRRKTARIRDCVEPLERGELRVAVTGGVEGFLELLREAAVSKRFGELRITNYVDILQQDPPLQFSAVCFHGKNWSFLAFRGTDSTLAGWKEDFQISVARTGAQELAFEYAEKHLTGKQKWYIGGHSKGGNLALYAACMLSPEQWDKVERMYLLDGPGFCPDVLNPDNMAEVDRKTRRIIPHFSVVGKLFEPLMTDTRIIKSFAHGFMQHAIDTWGVDHGKLALAEESDAASLWIHDLMDDWIRDLTQEERIQLIEDLFDALAAGGAATLSEIDLETREGREAILKSLREMSASTKHSLSDLPKYAMHAGVEGIREKIAEELAARGLKHLNSEAKEEELNAGDPATEENPEKRSESFGEDV